MIIRERERTHWVKRRKGEKRRTRRRRRRRRRKEKMKISMSFTSDVAIHAVQVPSSTIYAGEGLVAM